MKNVMAKHINKDDERLRRHLDNILANRCKKVNPNSTGEPLLPEQIGTLKKYYNYLQSKGVSLGTIRSYIMQVRSFGLFIKKPYELSLIHI